jgi:hypothetical protein
MEVLREGRVRGEEVKKKNILRWDLHCYIEQPAEREPSMGAFAWDFAFLH